MPFLARLRRLLYEIMASRFIELKRIESSCQIERAKRGGPD
ncbi:hypothetical protein [Paraburkholderia oxyphila]|nr:hypothetical protein [Paraburkholderia oxyphila]